MIDRYDPDLLLAYIEDELEGQELARFEQMMDEDAQLAALMQGLTSDRATLRSLPEIDSPSGLVDDALHQLERTMLLDGPAQDDAGPIPIQRGREFTAPISGRPWGRIMGISGMAAAVMIGAGLTYYVLLDDPLNRTALEMMQEDQEPASPTSATSTDEAAEFAEADDVNGRGNIAIGNNAPGAAIRSLDGVSEPRRTGDLAERATPQPLEAPVADEPESAGNSGLLDRAADAILAGPLAPGRDENPPSVEPTRETGPATEPVARPVTRAPVIALARNGFTEYDAASQLLVYTDSPETTQQQIFAWCVVNGIPVVETDQWVADDAPEGQAFANTAADRREATSTAQLALLIEDQQLGELVTVMNRIEVPQRNRQRAVLNQAQVGPQQRAQVRQQEGRDEPAVLSPFRSAEADESEDFYQLKAPSDLGDDELTDQNYDNVYRYNNRIATEGGYGPAAQPAQAPPAPVAPAQPNIQPMAAAAEQAEDAESVAPGEAIAEAEAQEQRDDAPADESPSEQNTREMEQNASDASAEGADHPRRATPRGNHLMPQLPLANTTPIWSETAQTRIVPIILRLAGADAIDSLDAPVEGVEDADVAAEAAEDAETQADDAAAPADD